MLKGKGFFWVLLEVIAFFWVLFFSQEAERAYLIFAKHFGQKQET